MDKIQDITVIVVGCLTSVGILRLIEQLYNRWKRARRNPIMMDIERRRKEAGMDYDSELFD